MAGKARDRWLPIGWSILLHGAIVAALAWGVWHFEREPPSPQPLATVVDARALRAAPRKPSPVQIERQRLERQRLEQQRLEAERRAAEERAALERREAEARESERLQAERLAADAERQARVEREARERAEQQARAEEDARRKAEAQRQAEAQRRAAAERAAAETRQRAEREAELQRGIEAEERARSAASSGLRAQWEAQIRARIQRAWIQPPSARPGIDCEVYMTQVPGGEVVNVRIGECNGDAAVRQSIEAAAYRASPLPSPPDPALFERSLVVRFRPQLESG